MQKLDPKAVWIFFFNFLFGGLIAVIIFAIWAGSIFSSLATRQGVQVRVGAYIIGWFLFIIVFLGLYITFCYIWAKLTYRYYGYQLTEDVFKKEYGIIWKKYVSIPYERIQNIDIHRGIFARILGLSDLHIQTAGASAVVYRRRMVGVGAEGRLLGLDKQVAEQLREELIKRAKGVKQGL